MDKKQKCVKCGKEFEKKDGVVLLRGASFACKDCHEKQKHENMGAEVCEFC